MSVLDIVAIVAMVVFGLLGLFTGLINRLGKIASFLVALVVAFFVASPITKAIGGTSWYTDTVVGSWFNGNESTAGIVALVVVFVVVFIILFFLLKWLFKVFRELVHKSKILKVLDSIVGAGVGVLTALFLLAIVMIILGFVGESVPSVAEWFENDLSSSCGLATWLYDFSGWFFDFASSAVEDVIESVETEELIVISYSLALLK